MTEISFGEHWWQFVLIAVVCYLFGSINFAWWISRSKHHKDITKLGSGNPGTMNMTRQFGWKAGLATFVCDALKGGLPVLAVYLLYKDCIFIKTGLLVSDYVRYFSAVFVVIGHIFPVTMNFRGGKGIASTLGAYWFALSCESLWWILIGFGIAAVIILFIYWTEWGSMGSLMGVSACSIIQAVYFIFRYANTYTNAHLVWIFSSLLALNFLTWCAHYMNVARLFAGEEHHTSLKKILKKK